MLSNLGLKTPLSTISLLSDILLLKYETNEIVKKLLLAGDKLMFAKNKEKIEKIKETGNSRYIYKEKLDKACFQNDMAYGNFKYLSRRTKSFWSIVA